MDTLQDDSLVEAPQSNLHRVPKVDHAQNLPGHVQQMLLEAILTRVLVPGERLLIDEIAAHFGISKIPVREAVKALVVPRPGFAVDGDRLINLVKARKGSHYAPKSIDTVDHIPVTPLGKPDKKAIRSRYWSASERQIH